jgi:hypothetical protein
MTMAIGVNGVRFGTNHSGYDRCPIWRKAMAKNEPPYALRRARRLLVAAFGSSRMRNEIATTNSIRNVGVSMTPTAGILLRVTAAQTAKTVKPIPLVMRRDVGDYWSWPLERANRIPR